MSNPPIGYIQMPKDEVVKRCKSRIDAIKNYQDKYNASMIAQKIKQHSRWKFLPWWKPMTRDDAIMALRGCWMFPSYWSERYADEARDLMIAAQATSENHMWIAVGASILS